MSILSKASLVQIPSGYGEDKLYSEVPNTTAGDFTFTRASTGTRVNADGYIEDVPWNQLDYSEDFSSWNTWRQGAALPVTITTDVAESPIGTLTADRIQCDQVSLGSPNRVGVRQDVAFAPLQRFTISVWAKSASGSDEALQMIARGATGITPGGFTATNEWQKFSRIVEMRSTGVTVNVIIGLFQNQTVTTTDIYLWGAQIVLGETEKTYIKTTDRLDIPRLDYSGGASCPTLLLEPQRTNLVDNGNTISNWTLQGVTRLLNQGTSPQNIQEATLISETNDNSNHLAFVPAYGLSSSSQYTYSGFVKQGTQRYAFFHLVLGSVRYGIIFDFVTKSVTDVHYNVTPINESYYFTEYNDGWFRLVISMQNSSASTAYPVIGLSDSPTPNYNSFAQPIYQGNSSKNIYVWGFQLEQGNYPTSYIPTSGTSVTRVADVSEKSGLSSLINSQEGVLFLEIKSLGFDTQNRSISIYDGISTNGHLNRVQIAYFGSDQISFLYRTISGNVFLQNINVTQQQTNKFALKYKENDFSAYINGEKVAEQLSGSVVAVGTFTNIATHNGNNVNNFFGKCKQLIYFNQALTDTELEELTTI
jgi:hypothetical protein